MASIIEGVYWCAHDLAGIAIVPNHHLDFLILSDPDTFEHLPFPAKNESGVHFCTLAAFKSTAGQLTFGFNEQNDVQSVLETINPDKCTSPFIPDLDLETHRVPPPHGSRRRVHEGSCATSVRTTRRTLRLMLQNTSWLMPTARPGSTRYSASPESAKRTGNGTESFSASIGERKT